MSAGRSLIANRLDSDMPGDGDLKESFYLGDARWFAHQGRMQDLPPSLSANRATLDRFIEQNTDLATTILRGLAVALGVSNYGRLCPRDEAETQLPQDYLADAHQGEHSRLRLLHYPPVLDHANHNG